MDYSTQELDPGVQKPEQEFKHQEADTLLWVLPAAAVEHQPLCPLQQPLCPLQPPAMLQTHPVLLGATATAKPIAPTPPALVKTEFVEEKTRINVTSTI